ncbi:MAG: NAD(P)-binding domain-containing protein, partial [Xanthomonadales bacterium]|nr:NAD(P)-binding domain-containing protein [Xanthomonadales bacterium]
MRPRARLCRFRRRRPACGVRGQGRAGEHRQRIRAPHRGRSRSRAHRLHLSGRDAARMSTLRIGFVGLGAMGGSMAGHLHRLGLLVAVSNRTHEKAARFAAEHAGVRAFADAGELAAHCDVVVSCVTADSDVLALAEALAMRAKPGFVLVDTSTIASTSARQAAGILRAVGADF